MLGLALAVGSLFATGATAAYLSAASMIVGIYTAREQRKKAQRALERSVKDRLVMVREATADRPYLFGRVRTSGQIQFLGSSGANSEYLHWTLALGDELDAVEAVWFNDAPIGTLDADGWTTEGMFYSANRIPTYRQAVVTAGGTITLAHEAYAIQSISAIATGEADPQIFHVGTPASDEQAFSVATVSSVTVVTFNAAWVGQTIVVNYTYTDGRPLARAKAFLGASGQVADPYLIAQLPTVWSATDRFTGTSYLSGSLNYNPDAYPSGVPDVSAVVRGIKCYDPRTSTTVWTRNPALIAWKWISLRFPGETYDSASLIAAANVCDEDVAIDVGTQDRYTFDDVISSDTSTVDGLERILQSMVGSAVRSAGVWYIWAGAWEEPTIALDESDLAPGEITVQGVAEDGSLFNGIGGRYTYANSNQFVEDSFPTYVSPAYVALDNDETEILDVDLTMISDVHRAQRVARLMLHKARQALTFSCTLEMSAFAVTPGTMVTWTIERYGWTAKPFRCLRRVYSPSTATIQAVFQEDAEAIYSSTYSELTTPDPAPNTDLPNPLVVATPTVTTDSGATFYTLSSDGAQRPYIRVYWEQMDESVERVEIWWRRADRTTWQQQTVPASQLMFDATGVSRSETWLVQVRAINGIGVRSAWTVATVVVSEDAPINGSWFIAGIGTNLARNASFESSTSPWVAKLPGETAITTGADRTALAGSIGYFGWAKSGNTYASYRPQPYSALVVVTTDSWVGDGLLVYQSSSGFAVEPGNTVELQCRAAVSGGVVKMGVYWYDHTGTPISVSGTITTLDQHLTTPSGYEQNLTFVETQYTGLTGVASYKLLFGFATAPATAAYAVPVFITQRNVTSGVTHYAVISMPYVGLASPGQQTPSAWGPGW